MSVIGRLRTYMASDDPHVQACNTIAMMLAWNQPFYPLYVLWFAGWDFWVSLPGALSFFPFFAVPWLCRRNAMLGRAVLVLVAVGNVILCSTLLGQAAGVQILYLPCGMLAAILFSWRERWVMAPLAALPLIAWLVTDDLANLSPVRLSDAANASLFRLNAISAGILMVFFGWLLASINRGTEDRLRD